MAKIDVIPLKNIEEYMDMIKTERTLAVRLHIYKEQQELQLKRLEEINNSAKRLKTLSDNLKLKPSNDEEVLKAIKKYARWY